MGEYNSELELPEVVAQQSFNDIMEVMEENNHNYIYGFPKVTQITYVNSDLETFIVRIPRTFFFPSPYRRSIHYEGLNFEVYRTTGNTENHSAVCTGIMKYHPPKTLKQLKDLITILTYFAQKDRHIIRQVKDIFPKQIHRLAMQVQTNPPPFIDLTNETAHQQQTGRGKYTRGFHPYSRTTWTEEGKSNAANYPNSTLRSNQEVLTSKSSFHTPSTFHSESFFNNKKPPIEHQSNVRSHGSMFQQNGSSNSDQQMSNRNMFNDPTTGITQSQSMYSNNVQNHNYQNVLPKPTVHPHTVTSSHMSSDVGVSHPNDFRNSTQAPYQTHIMNTATGGVLGLARSYPDHLNHQPITPLGHTQTAASNMTNSNFQQNRYKNPDQPAHYQPQIQIPSQIMFNQSTGLPSQVMVPYSHQPDGTNQAHFSNSLQLQNQNTSQHVQLVPTTEMPYVSRPFQMNTQNYVPIANVNCFPSSSFQGSFFMGRNQPLTTPSTSNNHLAPNVFPTSQTVYRPEDFYPFQSHQNQYTQNNLSQWSNNTQFVQNPEFTRSQNCPPAIPINSHINYELPPLDPNHHHQEYENWQTHSIPQINKPQAVQSNQACSVDIHATTISSNNRINNLVEPTSQGRTQNSKLPLHLVPTNSSASVNLSANKFKPINQDFNTQNGHAMPVNYQVGGISGVSTNTMATNIPQRSSFSAKQSGNNLTQDQPVSNLLNMNIKSVTKENFQSSVVQPKLGNENDFWSNYLSIDLIKDEPIDYEICGRSENEEIHHNSLGFENLQTKTSKSLNVVAQEDKPDDEHVRVLLFPDEKLGDDILEFINSNSSEVINSPEFSIQYSPGSSDSSRGLIIDENMII